MKRRLWFALVVFLPAAFLAAACGDSGPGPAFTSLTLTHRGEVLVVEAVVTPSDADIACTGAVPASGTGAVRDSVPVVHHDTLRTFRVICSAEANGASTSDTASYPLFGPNVRGDWVGVGVLSEGTYGLTIRDEANSAANTATIYRPDGTTIVFPYVVVFRSGDSVTIAASVDPSWWSGPVMRGHFEDEYRSIVGILGGLHGCGCGYTLRRR